jgi:hypothetical protein
MFSSARSDSEITCYALGRKKSEKCTLMFTASKQAIILRRLSFDVHCKQTSHYVAQVSGYRESKDVYFVLVII